MLKPNGRILPGHFELFLDPVQVRDDRTIPYHWEQKFHGIDFSSLAPAEKPWTQGKGYDKRALEPDDVVRNFAPFTSVLRLDLHRPETSVVQTSLEKEIAIATDGRLDGFALYFRAGFDDEVQFLAGPGAQKTHWASRLLRTETVELRAGSRMRIRLQI